MKFGKSLSKERLKMSEVRMLSLKEIPEDSDAEVLREQIEIRRNLLNQMVGSLYPSILADEIIALNERLLDLKHKSRAEG
jgi:hypothetical protein